MSERPAPIEYGELTILYQDENYVAIDKPAGLLVHRSFLDKHETQFAMQMLRDQIGQHVFPVHRLDRPTSGVLLFALNSEAARDMNQLFIAGTITKRYLALVRGFAPSSVFVDKPLKEELDKIADKFADQDKAAQEAQTQFNCLHQAALPIPIGKYPTVRYSLVECFPKTGRKHQIRRHLNHLSLPIIGDVNHGDNQHNQFFREQFSLRRLMLFATDLHFVHPYSNKHITIKAPLGEAMLSICNQLGWPSEREGLLMAHISIFVGSVYGGAERLSDQISDTIEQAGHRVSVFAEPNLEDIKNASHILIVTSTTGQGDIPSNLTELYNQLNSNFPMLTNKPFGIVAMGDRSYGDTFCGAGRSFDELLRDLQAKPIGNRLEIDACEDFEPWPVTEPWLQTWLSKLPA